MNFVFWQEQLIRMLRGTLYIVTFLTLQIASAQNYIFKDRQHVRDSYIESVTRWTCCAAECKRVGDSRKREQYFYDINGREIQRDIYIQHSSPESCILFFYDKKGILLRKAQYSYASKDTLSFTNVITDKKGNILKEEIDHIHRGKSTKEYKYSDDGLNTEIITFDSEGNIKEKVTYKYENEKVIEIEESRKSGEKLDVYKIIKYGYDEKFDFITDVSTFLKEDILISEETYNYSFDEKGKLVTVLSIENETRGPLSNCTVYFHYRFYEHD